MLRRLQNWWTNRPARRIARALESIDARLAQMQMDSSTIVVLTDLLKGATDALKVSVDKATQPKE